MLQQLPIREVFGTVPSRLSNLQPRLAETIDQLLDELWSPPLLEFLTRRCGEIRLQRKQFPHGLARRLHLRPLHLSGSK